MNKVVNLKQDLARPLQLGPCLVLPGENRIVCGKKTLRLEPRVMQVLVVLAENTGSVVSRQQLIDAAWSGRPITDDAITRCISILRRTFDAELQVPVVIETVSKIGYRLELRRHEQYHSGKYRTRWLLATAVTAAAILLFFLPGKRDASTGTWQLERLLVSPAAERHPAFSPDGTLLAYAMNTTAGNRDIFMRELHGDGVSRLTPGNGVSYQPVFSPDGKRIAYARHTPAANCEIRTVSIYGGRETLAGVCAAGGIRDLDWSRDGSTLYFIDRPDRLAGGTVRKLLLENGQVSPLTEANMQVDDLAISPDGRDMAITISRALGVEDLYIGPVSGAGPWQRLTRDNIKIHGIAWTADNNSLLFTSNRLGPFQLWRADRHSGKLQLVPEALHGGDAIAVSSRDVIALESWHEQSAVVSKDLTGAGGEKELVPDKGVNWDARRSTDGSRLLYVSDRSGSAEIWIEDDRGPFKLTGYGGPWVLSPRWSPDSRRISFVVPLQGKYRLQILDVEQKRVKPVAGVDNAFSPVWSARGDTLYYAAMERGDWQIFRVQLRDNRVQQITTNGGKSVQVSTDGNTVYFTKPDVNGIWQMSLSGAGKETLVTGRLAPVDWNNWQLLDEMIYFVVRVPDGTPQLWQHDIPGGNTGHIADLPGLLHFSGIEISPDHGRITYSRITLQDADINLMYRAGRE